MALHTAKKRKLWLIKAIDRSSGGTIAWVLGGRDSVTFRRLYNKLKHLKNCTFFTDNWDAFAEVLPPERHIIGKTGTVAIERDNSNTRHHLGRFTRRTKVVSPGHGGLNNSVVDCLNKPRNIYALAKANDVYL